MDNLLLFILVIYAQQVEHYIFGKGYLIVLWLKLPSCQILYYNEDDKWAS
jgi:hypothetical protein